MALATVGTTVGSLVLVLTLGVLTGLAVLVLAGEAVVNVALAAVMV
ncbi:MAG: hypothetical protein ACYC6L_08930 [Anaerolineae bacterium]